MPRILTSPIPPRLPVRLREHLRVRRHPGCAVVHGVGSLASGSWHPLLREGHVLYWWRAAHVRDPDRVAALPPSAATTFTALATFATAACRFQSGWRLASSARYASGSSVLP